MLQSGDPPGREIASVGLWVALFAGVALVVLGFIAILMNLGPGIWITLVGALFTAGIGMAIRFRS